MAQSRPSMQELIARRQRAGFAGRSAERAAFRANFDIPPEDDRHRFLFHVHGNAGVGKTFLVRELEQVARDRGALTAFVDENTGSVPEALAAIARQFAAQGRRLKDLERLLATHRERWHEAQAAAAAAFEPRPQTPSTGSTAVARAGVLGLGMMPVVGPFAGVLDPAQLAQGADRLRAWLSARFRSHQDVELVLSPESVLTPVLLSELSDAASAVPWIVLFFDTYERTGSFLDGWLRDVMTSGRYGALPGTVVVVTAGQLPFDYVRWRGFGEFVKDVPLGPFTDADVRALLASRGVVAEPVVDEVLRLTGGLPVLVSMLAEARPADPDDVGDPSPTAVHLFLRREQDPVRREVALLCALPRRLDADVFRTLVDRPDDELDALYEWLRGMPFVGERGDRLQYHDVVRAPMLRSQRSRSPQTWAERHRSLAAAFRQWRTETAAGRGTEEAWADEGWRELRLAESYHLLCAGERRVMPEVLRDLVDACDQGESIAGRWVQMLVDAGRDAGVEALAGRAHELSRALAVGGTADVLGVLLGEAEFDGATGAGGSGVAVLGGAGSAASGMGQGTAPAGRGSAGAPGAGRGTGGRPGVSRDPLPRGPGRGALARSRGGVVGAGRRDTPTGDDWSSVLPRTAVARAYRVRATAHDLAGNLHAAVADLNRALRMAPQDALSLTLRGEYHRALELYGKALDDLDRAIRLNPVDAFAWASRGATRLSRGEFDAALADLDRAVELKADYPWALVRRARVHRALGDPVRQLADLDRAVSLDPDWAWVRCERGDALRVAGRDQDALADYDHALTLEPGYGSARASRGASLANLGRYEEALADLNRALELRPSYTWAAEQLAAVRRRMEADPGR
ncbi:tetratricopeptide repeat protein [Streptomyces sp. NPDC049627]|uniref:tetratricopeptide repeat protein n=1 Tax=Streptomyces sp. NPDC049627 TaxID=3365595 RepID=UPI0037B02EDC